MLEPNSRALLIDSLKAPEGYRLDRAICTSYSVDLLTLMSVPVAFAFSDAQDQEGRPLTDPLALLKATREYADRMLLFHHPGKIHVPHAYQPLLASMENSLAEAIAPRGGSFHPKTAILRMVDGDQNVLYRFLCLSRNLTFERTWDTQLVLEGVLKDRANNVRRSKPLGDFVEALPALCPRPLSEGWIKQVQLIASEIRRVDFAPPEGFDDFVLYPMGINNSQDPLDDRCDRLLAISPFVSDALVDELAGMTKHFQLVSRADQLRTLKLETLERISAVWTLDDSLESGAELTADDDGPSQTEGSVDDSAEATVSGQEVLSGLHAKVYVMDQGWKATVVTGSANATDAAFRSNVEFMVALTGKKKWCGIDAVLGSGERSKKAPASFGDLLVPYSLTNHQTACDTEEQKFELQVDDLAKQISQAAPICHCQVGTSEGLFNLTLKPSQAFASAPPLLKVEVRLISSRNRAWQTIDWSQTIWAEFQNVALLDLTPFVVFRVTGGQSELTRVFVVQAAIENAPPERQDALIQSILSDSDRVQRFLLLLLDDSEATGASSLLTQSDSLKVGSGDAYGQGPGLFESLVSALIHSPEKLKQIADVVERLMANEETAGRLPTEFQSIWQPIYSAWLDENAAVSDEGK